tara:strand:+ start:305 stop:511 length:207 start_codon:yes stop_codon:yes gene_type:complete
MAKDWKLLYKSLEKKNKKLKIDNDQLNKVNEELNIMDTQKIKKIILLGREIHKLKGGQIVKRTKDTNI